MPALPSARNWRYLGFATKISTTPIPRMITAVLKLLEPTSPTTGSRVSIVLAINQKPVVFFFVLLICHTRKRITAIFENSEG